MYTPYLAYMFSAFGDFVNGRLHFCVFQNTYIYSHVCKTVHAGHAIGTRLVPKVKGAKQPRPAGCRYTGLEAEEQACHREVNAESHRVGD